MSRDLSLFLEDIIDRSKRIDSLVQDCSFEDFIRDDAIHEAILRHLAIIGEAVKRIPDDKRDRSQAFRGGKSQGCATFLCTSTSALKTK